MLRPIVAAFALTMSFSLAAKPVAHSDNDVAPLLNGHDIPDVTLQGLDGKPVNLQNLAQQKPTIFFFYRGGWCPFCNMQMGQLQGIQPKLIEMGFQLVGISPDSPEKLRKSMTKNKLDYMLLSDSDNKAAQAFGVAFYTSKKVTARYARVPDLKEKLVDIGNGDMRIILPVPAIFLSDKSGLIHFQYVNPNFRVRAEPELLLTAAKLVADKQK
ncbi:AhpC/TSA family protein [Shewanella sp. 202IG2-18]|uniref:peroxiredoxin-like family protein n=1 Tax=Parashewanella hymeniacidonis TaxID=2807618 RepID=UPI00195FDAF8|nr:peroxiredoxin-like family protein [Parashewanella hymeniacidonis]MBM7070632.1 AhpC/TSA family protein [Parashewanella hymeniacidonis]